jgi:Phage-related lysozyme (muraminidase)
MTARKIGTAGLALVKCFEGRKLRAYRCPAGVWTVGYGSTGPHVKPGMVITEQRAEALLHEDLSRFEAAVDRAAPGATQNQFDAMVSLAFNIGIDAFNRSTVLRKHKAKDFEGASAAFAMWNKAGGKVVAGLVRRRAAEADLYAA